MEETRVELGYLLKSYYSNTITLLISVCMDRVWVCKKFVMDVTCPLMAYKYQWSAKNPSAATNMRV